MGSWRSNLAYPFLSHPLKKFPLIEDLKRRRVWMPWWRRIFSTAVTQPPSLKHELPHARQIDRFLEVALGQWAPTAFVRDRIMSSSRLVNPIGNCVLLGPWFLGKTNWIKSSRSNFFALVWRRLWDWKGKESKLNKGKWNYLIFMFLRYLYDVHQFSNEL